jgi:hypothetical protein
MGQKINQGQPREGNLGSLLPERRPESAPRTFGKV